MVTGIIGAGASGMAAALAAAENESGQVVLMERQARVGRKLQATGNGRCNLSNLHGTSGGYHGENPGFADYALGKFPPNCGAGMVPESGASYRGGGFRAGVPLFRSGKFRGGCAAVCSGKAEYHGKAGI